MSPSCTLVTPVVQGGADGGDRLLGPEPSSGSSFLWTRPNSSEDMLGTSDEIRH